MKPYTSPRITTNLVSIESSIAAGSAIIQTPDLDNNIRHEWDDLPDVEKEIMWN